MIQVYLSHLCQARNCWILEGMEDIGHEVHREVGFMFSAPLQCFW